MFGLIAFHALIIFFNGKKIRESIEKKGEEETWLKNSKMLKIYKTLNARGKKKDNVSTPTRRNKMFHHHQLLTKAEDTRYHI